MLSRCGLQRAGEDGDHRGLLAGEGDIVNGVFEGFADFRAGGKGCTPEVASKEAIRSCSLPP